MKHQAKNSTISRREVMWRSLAAAGGLVIINQLPFRTLADAASVSAEQPQSLPEFPADLRRKSPVANLSDAVVFTMNNKATASNAEYMVDLSCHTGSDVLIRCWFKWGEAPPVQQWRWMPPKVHQMGGLFGGGITCSALVEGENGLTRAQLLDMATRGPDGQLVNAWGQPNIRHGSLSSPAYLDYLFRWCREQMDAGADYLFMDENTGALQGNEGYDDYSLDDFRIFLLNHFPAAQNWTANDVRWQREFKIELTNPHMCKGRDMRTFNYREYLRERGLLSKPESNNNPLAPAWREFRIWRDDRAWKSLTDRIRTYAAGTGRRVFISANGLVRYVDLQVLGVWKRWQVKDGRVDLSQSQLEVWRELIVQGQTLAGKRVPVVLFQDWGAGKPHFPWLTISPGQRKVWIRIRGAEIYAAGGFFAFPVLGAFGDDAYRDGTLETILQQTQFYQTHRQLYSRGQFLNCNSVRARASNLSLAVWTTEQPQELAIHVINREANGDRIPVRLGVAMELPLTALPESATAVSPDWPGERLAACTLEDGRLRVTLKELEAYAVVRLRYSGEMNLPSPKELPHLSSSGE